MIFAYLSVNSFMRNASKPGPPAVIRTVCGLSHSLCSTARIACGRAGRERPARMVVDSLIITFPLNVPSGIPAAPRASSGADPHSLG